MRNVLALNAAIAMFVLSAVAASAYAAEPAGVVSWVRPAGVSFVPDEVIVKFKSTASNTAIADVHRRHGTIEIYTSPYGGFKRVRIPPGKTIQQMVTQLGAEASVEYAEPNSVCHAFMTPNDPMYNYQWNFHSASGGINLPPAWDESQGSGVIVAVLDSGVAYEDYDKYTKAPDLANTTFVPGYDFINSDAHPNDDNNHGTHVTGTIAQSTNNNLGVAGIAFNCSIMPVKVLDEKGTGTAQTLADGLHFAADNGADIVNMSLGWPVTGGVPYDPGETVRAAVQYAHDKGVVIVCASGNDGQGAVGYPAAYDAYCVAVGATRYDETRSYYSNYGTSLDIVAPGGDTTVDQNGDGYVDGILQDTFAAHKPGVFGYYLFQGTSMATPHVSGVAALIIAKWNWPRDVVIERLLSTAKDLGPSGWDAEYGYGLVNAGAALADGPTYVSMSTAAARSVGVGAFVEWTTESEVENFGFQIFRRLVDGNVWECVNARPVPGRLTAAGAKSYGFLDFARPGRYEYCIESISTAGTRDRYGPDLGMAVNVRPVDTASSLGELASLLPRRGMDGIAGLRASSDTALRRSQLSVLCSANSTQQSSGNNGQSGYLSTQTSAQPAVRLLSSTVGLFEQDHVGNVRPSPGDLRVRTRSDGIHFIPSAALPAKPQHISLLRDGSRFQPLKTDNTGIWFFAPAYRDVYTDANATFITSSQRTAGASQVVPAPAELFAREAMFTARATARAEENTLFISSDNDAPDAWFYSTSLVNGSPEQTVQVETIDLAEGPALLRVAVFGYTCDNAVNPDHELVVSFNDNAVADLTWDGRRYKVFEIPIDAANVKTGINSVSLLTPDNPAIPNGHGIVLDYVEIEYVRSLSIASGPLLLETQSPGVVEISGLAQPALWAVHVGQNNSADLVGSTFSRLQNGLFRARFQAHRGSVYYLASPESISIPTDIREATVADVPRGTSYLAIGPAGLRPSVEPLLEARRSTGLSSAFVSLDAAIDTFGFGRYGAAAITKLVRNVQPGYVLLVGDNSYDFHNYEHKNVDPMVPSVLVATRYECQTNADALFGDLDSDGTPDIPVGRLPVRTADQLDRLVAKILDHKAYVSTMSGVLVACESDESNDFAADQERVRRDYPEVDWVGLYARTQGDHALVMQRLTELVNTGADLVVYQGHGGSVRLASGTPILDLREAARWTGTPVVYLSTCWGAVINRNTEAAASIAEVLLRSPTGSPAVIGSSTLTGHASQAQLLNDFLQEALQKGVPIGKALVDAQRKAADMAETATTDEVRRDLLAVVQCYVVLGDPAMPLVLPMAGQDE